MSARFKTSSYPPTAPGMRAFTLDTIKLYDTLESTTTDITSSNPDVKAFVALIKANDSLYNIAGTLCEALRRPQDAPVDSNPNLAFLMEELKSKRPKAGPHPHRLSAMTSLSETKEYKPSGMMDGDGEGGESGAWECQ